MFKEEFAKFIYFFRAATQYKGFLQILLDLVRHKLVANIDPRDYFKSEFYKPAKSMEEKSRYISYKGSKFFPYDQNPLKYNFIFTNKEIQKKFLEYLGLPVVGILTYVGHKKTISNKDQLFSFLESIKERIVIKPISGTHGSGFLSLSPAGKDFYLGEKRYSKNDIWSHITKNEKDYKRGFLIENKVENSDAIRSIYPESLNTYRIVTVKTTGDRWCNMCNYLRIGRDGNNFDNSQIQVIAGADGCSTIAYDHIQNKRITHHPNTQRPLVGIRLDGCQQAVELALKASKMLYFMGALGWDIAITKDGPLIIEVNAWWGNSFQKALGRGAITDDIAKGLDKRNIFTSWDKSRMYPNFYQGPLPNRIIERLKRNIVSSR